MGIKAALPKYELYFYTLVLSLAGLWAASWIFEASSVAPNTRSLLRSTVYMVYGMLAVLATMGLTFTMLILSHCVLLYSVSLSKQKWLCFAAGLCSLATFKLEPFSSWQSGFVTGTFALQDVLFYGGSGFTIMRCMSFALENYEKKDGNYSFLELLKYNFYLPFFFFGPIMTFDRFHAQVNTPDLTRKEHEMWNIRIQAVLHLASIVVVDVLFHFLYILTIPSDMKLVKQLSDWSLAGLAYSNLVYDWVKAAVMFGVINTVSRLDHLDPPQPPKCITMLYVFAETYVYDHLGGNHDNIVKELLATVCTFAVTTLWLGPCHVVYIWSFFNCFGLNFELWVAKFFELEPFASMEAKMSEATSRRIRGVFNAANFWTIILYNVLALNSLDFANLVFKRYVYDHLGGNHDNIVKELLATVCTFAVTTLWLGPCHVVYIWSFFNCFGLNFELWVAKFFELEPFASMEAKMSEATSRRIRGVFNAANFWTIILYNVLALNSLDFANLVFKRLIITGFPLSTLIVLFVTYCGVQLIKERERRLALEEEGAEKEKTE
ncbi:UNVERIFIED_CONTAM: hypothetical protein FKN15_042987 [Acipenser sinensis]